MRRDWRRTATVLATFAALFAALTVSSYTRMSSTWDEPFHLTAGYAALRDGDYRFGVSGHMPLLRLWAALPLLATPEVTLNTGRETYRRGDQMAVSFNFLYRSNDADRLLNRARFMTVILGIALGILVYCWARELYGPPTAAAVLALYCFEPNVLAHAGLVTTDIGATLFLFGTVYALWRTCRRLSIGSVLAVAACFALAVSSKLNTLLLAPLLALLLAIRTLSPSPWPVGREGTPVAGRSRRALLAAGVLLAAALAAWVGIWGVFRFRWELAADPSLGNIFDDHSRISNVSPGLLRAFEAFDRLRLLPHGFTEGLLHQLNSRQDLSYFGGVLRERPFWYFFPAAFLLKAPTSLVLLVAGGLALLAFGRRLQRQDRLFVLVPPALYLAAAMGSGFNSGIRHLLPIYPFLLLAAGSAVQRLLTGRLKPVLAGLALLWAAEFAAVYPDYLAAFNFPAGGPANGANWLVDSNLDWGQGLKGLGEWMRENRVPAINLCYFGMADPRYYGVQADYLPGSQFYEPERDRGPRLPGYVAVSATHLVGLFSGDEGRAFYRGLRTRRPDAVIRRSINVYRVDAPWWDPGRGLDQLGEAGARGRAP